MAKVKDDKRAWQKIVREVKRAHGKHVVVGYIDSGTPHAGGGMTNVQLAAIHEYGAPAAGIPERSFIRSGYDAKHAEWAKLSDKLAASVYDGKRSPEEALGLLGQVAASDLKKRVMEGVGIPPPLKPATIAAKGSERPLVDTGRLITSLTYEVRGDG